ncbi:hypothetical protein OG921_11710 [Aldersonia sp. NBC_00410]|uniref:hypothetical protein n=1 Tax=Aldersonia sp. NBC_00410 TaxID=2975954 RepID=UPI00225BF48F|nr:hypothetical protein [Aldersonia sp. NBC_00410]MCX5043832.1 hypothetical protein [Aldersonia sp. NBC_00410]
MTSVFEFAGSYWWLVFPIGGVVGGWASRVARYNEKRRQDKIELERVRASAKTEQLKLTRATNAQIHKSLAAHDALNQRWFDYEVDLATIIDYPLMTDLREPLTLQFHRAKLAADDLRPDDPGELFDIDRYTEYRDAVHAYSLAFDTAEREAKRRKQSHFNPIERAALERARKLVMVAMDEAATPAERQSAYRKARRELDGLIALPEVSTMRLEQRIAGALESAPHTHTE